MVPRDLPVLTRSVPLDLSAADPPAQSDLSIADMMVPPDPSVADPPAPSVQHVSFRSASIAHKASHFV